MCALCVFVGEIELYRDLSIRWYLGFITVSKASVCL